MPTRFDFRGNNARTGDNPVLVTTAAIFKISPEDGPLILTQRRVIQTEGYDPLNDEVWEAQAGTWKTEESPLERMLTEIREETGSAAGAITVFGAGFEPAKFEDYKGGDDRVHQVFAPINVVRSIVDSHPWVAMGFAIQVDPTWEPDPSRSDGEAVAPSWWKPPALLKSITEKPGRHMSLHAPLLREVGRKLASGWRP